MDGLNGFDNEEKNISENGNPAAGEKNSENGQNNYSDTINIYARPDASSDFGMRDDGTYRFVGNSASNENVQKNDDTGMNGGNSDAENYRTEEPRTEGEFNENKEGTADSTANYPYINAGNERTGSYPYSGGGNGGAHPYPNAGRNNEPYPYSNYANPGKNRGKGSNRKTVTGLIIAVAALSIVLIAGVLFLVGNGIDTNKPGTQGDNNTASEESSSQNVDEIVTSASPAETSASVPSGSGLSANEVYKKISPSSVGVIVYEGSSDSESGEGTGVILKEDNNGEYTYIITCAHVIKSAKNVVVQLADNTDHKAEIVGYDSRTDIGVLKIKATGLTAAEIGDSSVISVGDTVYAIGNPGGTSFAGSFTNGMISALDRPVSANSGYTMECIQHTAAINPGNSGGALVNTSGQLIGINSSKIVSEDYEGMGFSVPSSVFIEIFNKIIKNGYVADRAKLGITYVKASDIDSYGMYVAIKGLPAGSLVINSISEDSDLNNTDAKKGDMIVSVNGKDLKDSADLPALIEKSSVGDTLTLGIVRINKDYSANEFGVRVRLVEDKSGTSVEEETTEEEYDLEDYFRQFYEQNGGNYGSDPGEFDFDFGR